MADRARGPHVGDVVLLDGRPRASAGAVRCQCRCCRALGAARDSPRSKMWSRGATRLAQIGTSRQPPARRACSTMHTPPPR